MHNKEISPEEYTELYVTGSQPGILYGLPKIHKPNVPLRSILSSIGTAGYGLLKFFVSLLKPLTFNQYTVKNSFSFVEEITNIPNSNSYTMVSFDVQSLFTNIPLVETINIAADKYFSQESYRFFSLKSFSDLLTLAVKDIIFLFNSATYSQIEGIRMGNPLGPSFANIFLCYHENNWLENCPELFKPKFYRRYVDYLFLLFENPNQVTPFFNYLNSQHSNIKFTMEKEADNKLTFLDVSIVRSNNKFSTCVYRKPTFTGLGLKYSSFIPCSFKHNLIGCLVDRCYKICSSYSYFHLELQKLRKYFSGNNFPQFLFDKSVSNYLDKIYDKNHYLTCEKLKVYIKLPYLGLNSHKMTKDIKTVISKYYPQTQLNIALINSNTLDKMFPFKDKIPYLCCSCVIYKYQCDQCSSSYIGETQKQLKYRIFQHKGVSCRTGNRLTCPPNSNIRQHALDFDHSIKLENFKLVNKSNKYEIKIVESILIHKLGPNLNDRGSSFPLSILQ